MKYYNDGPILGVVGLPDEVMTHDDAGFTHLVGRVAPYNWIRTSDLYDTYEQAKQSTYAYFHNQEKYPSRVVDAKAFNLCSQ